MLLSSREDRLRSLRFTISPVLPTGLVWSLHRIGESMKTRYIVELGSEVHRRLIDSRLNQLSKTSAKVVPPHTPPALHTLLKYFSFSAVLFFSLNRLAVNSVLNLLSHWNVRARADEIFFFVFRCSSSKGFFRSRFFVFYCASRAENFE